MWNLWQNLSCGKALMLLTQKLIGDVPVVVLQGELGKKYIKNFFFPE